jgi:two-component system, chemotaxis family, sensor kinase CheA
LNDRRQALIGKFRASAAERLHRLLLWLGELEGGSTGRMQELRRELHTLKGEATMLGFAPMSDVVHAAEGRLARAAADGPEALRDGARVVAESCEAVIRWLSTADAEVLVLEAARAALEAPSNAPPVPIAAPSAPKLEPPAPAPEAAPQPQGKADRWVQVQARRIDELCERASDFEVGFRALSYDLRALADGRTNLEGGLRALLPEIDRARAALEEITASAWSLRLVPLEPALAELVSHARQIAVSQGKRMRVVVRASDAQIERTVLDVIWEPLLHLVRNAVDHGIELPAEREGKGEAMLAVEAEAVGASIVLSISDDGRGIDVSKLRDAAVARSVLSPEDAAEAPDAALLDLIFQHGFSTRTSVTDLSGRGIGLDVVRSSVESIGGSVRVSSEVGKGTRFALSVPASISKERALVFRVGKALYALPSRAVASVVQLGDSPVSEGPSGRTLMVGDDAIMLRSMGRVLGPVDPTAEPWAAVVEVGTRRVAFSMDRPHGELPLLRRPVDRLLAASGAVNGSAILEDGRIVLMLAAAGLIRQSDRKGPREPRAAAPPARRSRVLVVDDSAVVRDLMTQVLEHAGFDVTVAPGGAEGIAEFTAGPPDIVLLDIDMPEVDGFEVLRRIREADGAVPVVMLSLRTSQADQHRASLLGASAYFAKSQFQETTIVDALRRLVEVE